MLVLLGLLYYLTGGDSQTEVTVVGQVERQLTGRKISKYQDIVTEMDRLRQSLFVYVHQAQR